ncbi:glycerophosphodiester phosphodiesterase family protein [Dysgonomonas sp. Marseille-P4677]|uniref:glycerophosphodiester phosphodiesterase family protein n=1 Tax=Dysgonomonas sp. Marseille-P4677 TaxID=2364790 RepID=UPI001912EC23|nr:glycerophosphodiester phosphodiesterase family protein [Dysgonomonas sp. Marseille-P4677]MBK5723103.1 glycerophosphodiester phosphodiesterase family protein [Dysgonomonas sp. Marseille-P4677]
MKRNSYILILLFHTVFLSFCPAQVALVADTSVLVASHRGDWRNYADNSLEGIVGCIAMGVDIVELDVSRTKDGHLILMHDKTVDRTTNGKGAVSDLTLEQIKELRLRNGLGRPSEFTVPTLEEAMHVAKGKIRVNLDKADKYFREVYEVLERTGTVEQTIIKSERSYSELRVIHGEALDRMTFMPVVNINEATTIAHLDSLLSEKYPYYEIVFKTEDKEKLRHIQDKLRGTGSVIWINSLWPSLCGGYSDDRALKDAEGTWGYLIRTLGAGIIQTDRPLMMLEYLRKEGLHP